MLILDQMTDFIFNASSMWSSGNEINTFVTTSAKEQSLHIADFYQHSEAECVTNNYEVSDEFL